MWKVVYIAQNKESMKRAKLLLEKNGFLVEVKQVNSGAKNSISELCVPFSEAEEAYELIYNNMNNI